VLGQKSEVWANMLQVPQLPGGRPEESDDSNLVHIDVPSNEFSYLLEYLYDVYVCLVYFYNIN
jgi:hypothetical protein